MIKRSGFQNCEGEIVFNSLCNIIQSTSWVRRPGCPEELQSIKLEVLVLYCKGMLQCADADGLLSNALKGKWASRVHAWVLVSSNKEMCRAVHLALPVGRCIKLQNLIRSSWQCTTTMRHKHQSKGNTQADSQK